MIDILYLLALNSSGEKPKPTAGASAVVNQGTESK